MEEYLKVLDEVALKNAELARRQYDPEKIQPRRREGARQKQKTTLFS